MPGRPWIVLQNAWCLIHKRTRKFFKSPEYSLRPNVFCKEAVPFCGFTLMSSFISRLVSSRQLNLDEYDRESILLDLVEQALSFAINQGWPSLEICFFVSFYISALDVLDGDRNTDGSENTVDGLTDRNTDGSENTVDGLTDRNTDGSENTVDGLTDRNADGSENTVDGLTDRNTDGLTDQTNATSLASVVHQLQNVTIPRYSNDMTPSSLQAVMAFVTKSILQHFHLYQFLLTHPHATDLTTVEATVETPDREPPSLDEGVEEEAWLKMKKIEELKAEFEKKMEEMGLIREEAVSQAEANLRDVYKTQLGGLADGPKKISYQQVSDIVGALVTAHIDSSVVTLAHSLLQQNMELEFRVEQLEILAAAARKGTPHGSTSSCGSSPRPAN